MIHDHALMMIHYQKYDQQVHIQICNFIINSVACYMFRPSVVAIFRELFVEVYIT